MSNIPNPSWKGKGNHKGLVTGLMTLAFGLCNGLWLQQQNNRLLIGLWPMKESQIMREKRGIEERESRNLRRWRTERKKKEENGNVKNKRRLRERERKKTGRRSKKRQKKKKKNGSKVRCG
jgi:hypothetical protein